MKNIYSNIYSFNRKNLEKTIKSLKQANIVGLPTETVYGLAGNAYSKKAVISETPFNDLFFFNPSYNFRANFVNN